MKVFSSRQIFMIDLAERKPKNAVIRDNFLAMLNCTAVEIFFCFLGGLSDYAELLLLFKGRL